MTKTIKEIYSIVGSPLLLDATMTYPTIEGNTSNFLTYYDANKEEFDRYFLKEYGKRLIDFDSEEDEDITEEWQDELAGIQRIYLESWARLWYALNIDFNPVYNVEEHTVTTYGEDETTSSYGQHQRTSEYGQKINTDGSHTDTSTNYAVSYDSAQEKETGKTSDLYAEKTTTEGQHTDTHTDAAAEDVQTRAEHIDTVDRAGNIGVVSATHLIKEEINLRSAYSFFKNIFLIIINETGAYHAEPDFCR